ncbi:MAG: dethiobiotin synthase, partial [Candidatus Omnitrophota bacterium]
MVGAGGIFVTGTDTNVGKTVIACLIARGLRRYGIDCGVMKPVQCGGRDARRLMRAAGAKDSLSLVLPMFSPYACAPSIALPRAGVRFSPARIKQAYRKLSLRHEFMVVEGAGGVLAPLAAKYFILDLIQDLGLPAVVVAAAGLGTINHTLLTIECLRARGIKILGLIFNNLSPRRDISQTH